MSTDDLKAQIDDIITVLQINQSDVQPNLSALQSVSSAAKAFKLDTTALDAAIDFEQRLPSAEWIDRLQRLRNRPIILAILSRIL